MSDIQLAINSIQAKQIQSEDRAALAYNIPRMTIHDRRAGKPVLSAYPIKRLAFRVSQAIKLQDTLIRSPILK
jgi:hypothetical protein